jgi:hypothetical protein
LLLKREERGDQRKAREERSLLVLSLVYDEASELSRRKVPDRPIMQMNKVTQTRESPVTLSAAKGDNPGEQIDPSLRSG